MADHGHYSLEQLAPRYCFKVPFIICNIWITTLQIVQTKTFRKWLCDIREPAMTAAITARVARLGAGHPGDVKHLSEGLWEMRIHQGPGLRIYFTRRSGKIVILLCGGDKGSQKRDIERAKSMLNNLEF